jgi:hypothetical protein
MAIRGDALNSRSLVASSEGGSLVACVALSHRNHVVCRNQISLESCETIPAQADYPIKETPGDPQNLGFN